MKAGTVYICERHFQESDIKFTSKQNSESVNNWSFNVIKKLEY